MLTIVANRAANAKGVICDLPIKNEFQAGVIATVHFKIASRLFQIYQAVQDELIRLGINREQLSSHLVTKLHHAALVGFDLRQMEGDVSVELLEERYPITNQDRQDRITNFVG